MASKRFNKEPMPAWGHELVMTDSGTIAPIKDICQMCEDDREGWTLLACDRCDFWFHIECLKITKEQTKKIINYYCPYCSKKYYIQTEWRQRKPNKEKKLDKEENYYEVEEIISCRGQPPNREFFVSWKGYSREENCWVKEEDMDGSLDLMQDFLMEHNEPLSSIVGIMGSSKKNKINKSNWIAMEKLVEEFGKYKTRYVDYCNLGYEAFKEEFGEEDKLYFLKWESHCYVLLYIFEKKMIYRVSQNI